jgi:hypothetical protein
MALRAAVAALLIVACAAPAAAAPKRAKESSGPLVVNLENRRKLALTKFEIVAPAVRKMPEKILAKLAAQLAGGGRVDLPVARAKGCVFEARWKFEDLEDSASVDLCTDAHIVLVD